MDNNTMNYNSDGQADQGGNVSYSSDGQPGDGSQYDTDSQHNGSGQYDANGQYDNNNGYTANNQYISNDQYNAVPYGMNNQYNTNNQYYTNANGQYSANGQYGMPGYGQPSPYYQQPYQESIYAQPGESGSTDGKAIASLICGVFSLVTCCCYGITSLVFGTIAIILAVLSRKDNMGQMPGLAVAGLILGIIGVISGFGYIGLLIIGILTA